MLAVYRTRRIKTHLVEKGKGCTPNPRITTFVKARSEFRRRVPRAGFCVVLGVLFRCLGLERSVARKLSAFSFPPIRRPIAASPQDLQSSCEARRDRIGIGMSYLRDLLLRPLEISADFASILHPVRKAGASLCEARLGLCLQLHQLALLGIEMSRSGFVLVMVFKERRTQDPSLRLQNCQCFQQIHNCRPMIPGRRIGYSRLRLPSHALVKRDGVKCGRKPILHVLVEVDSGRRASRVVVTLAASGVAGSSGRITRVAVGWQHRRPGTDRLRRLWWRHRIGAFGLVVGLILAFADGDRNGYGAGVVILGSIG